jgi:hypothetical protein
MKLPFRKTKGKKKKRWRRRIGFAIFVVFLLTVIGVGFFLANLEQIVLRALRASLPGLNVSLDSVSLKSLSHAQIKGLRISGARPPDGSIVSMPRVDAHFRLHPFKGLLLNSLDFHGAELSLRPGVGAILSSLARQARTRPVAAGPAVGKISLTNSMVDVRMPDFQLACGLEALADSSSTGVLLHNTHLSFGLHRLSLTSPPLRLRDLDTRLSALIAAQPPGQRIDVLRGELHIPAILQTRFSGNLFLQKSSFQTEWQADVTPFQLARLLPHLEKSFPQIRDYRIEGQGAASLRLRFSSGPTEELLLSGGVHLRAGRAEIPLPELLLLENVSADLPFQCLIRGGTTSLALAPDEQHFTGPAVAASRIAYNAKDLATDLLASFEFHNEVLKSSNAFFRSHGGSVSARLSGMFRDETANLQAELDAHDIDLREVFRRFGLQKYDVWGPQTAATAHLSCTAGPEDSLKIAGRLVVRVPEAIVTFKKPLTVSGLQVDAPFEYSYLSGVETFGVRPSDSHPFAGSVIAERIDYGEKVAEDGTSRPQWSVSDFWASIACTDTDAKLTDIYCLAYDGDVTGHISASLEKKGLSYAGGLQIENLDLERLLKSVGVKKEKFYINGLVRGELEVSGKRGMWDKIDGQFAAAAPGGIIRIENVERLFESLPAGKALLAGLKEQYTQSEWNLFVEGMKEFRYRTATAEIKYLPFELRPEGAFGLDIKIHIQGTGAGHEFDIPITIAITFEEA